MVESCFNPFVSFRVKIYAIDDYRQIALRGCVFCFQVIELPVKHPELFEALGIAQPKVHFIAVTFVSCIELMMSFFSFIFI